MILTAGGMSLRTYIATSAMAAMIRNSDSLSNISKSAGETMAIAAYDFADHMICEELKRSLR